jgi:hypothetical protein
MNYLSGWRLEELLSEASDVRAAVGEFSGSSVVGFPTGNAGWPSAGHLDALGSITLFLRRG